MAPRSDSWKTFAEGLRRQRLMDDMMVVQQVDILTALSDGEAFVRARSKCRNCACEGACRDWLLEGPSKSADFCPNLGFFASLNRSDKD